MIWFRIGCVFLFAIQTAYAYKGFDICNYGNEIIEAVVCEGPAVLKGTTVKGALKVAGPLTAVNVIADSIAVTGSTDLQQVTIKGESVITGNLQAKGTQFQQNVQVIGEQITFSKTRVRGNLLVQSESVNPTLNMECSSLVRGTVIFVGKAGVINISNDSIIQGKITNGSMIFVKKICP